MWYRTGNRAYEEIRIDSSDYGDDYSEIDYGRFEDESDFFNEEVSFKLDEFDNFQDIESFLSDKKTLWEEYQKLKYGQFIVTLNGNYYETLDRKTMYFTHDTKHTVIGVI